MDVDGHEGSMKIGLLLRLFAPPKIFVSG